ncbi:hypothetical protein Droror1_Dr00010236 [Drosera rotundifolia]
MIKTLNLISASSSKTTNEIMSRYRPIAPRPVEAGVSADGSPKMSHGTYLSTVWSNLQARPARSRKRGRGGGISPLAIKRRRSSRTPITNPDQTIYAQGFAQCGLPWANIETHQMILSCPMPAPAMTQMPPLVEEKDLQLELKLLGTTGVISPQPIRPVGSRIRVGLINKEELHAGLAEEKRRPEEVEKEMEAEELPAIISDSNNRVRMTNSAYKEMVGQPGCPWLDSTIGKTSAGKGGGRRISGEVVIQDVTGTGLPMTKSEGFSCWVRIDWESKGEKKWINALGEVMRLCCDSKDYLFTWRFHVQERDECSLELATSISM